MGYSNEEILKGIFLFEIISQKHYNNFLNVFRQVIMDGISQYIETEFITRDGKTILLEGIINCKLSANSPRLVQCFFRDVTEYKQMKAALEEKSLRILKRTNELAEAQLLLIRSNMQQEA